jgi:glycosyltransferase involved in cell wall biosynthesis
MAARLLGVASIPNIAGLGTVFVNAGATRWLVERLYRLALSRSSRVFFQNTTDHQQFLDRSIVEPRRTEVLPGSGVDSVHFAPRARHVASRTFNFLFIGRLLREKGVPEFVEAARRIRRDAPTATFRVLGFAGVSNPSAIQLHELRKWVDEGSIEYLGEAVDVRPYIADADCVVLPSYYREGVPRSLLEAAAMEKAVITTDMPGCRDALVNGVSGLLVRPRDVDDLVVKMRVLLDMPQGRLEEMGRQGRLYVRRNFDEWDVISRYLQVLAKVAPRAAS